MRSDGALFAGIDSSCAYLLGCAAQIQDGDRQMEDYLLCPAPPTPTQMIFRVEQAKKTSFSVKLNVTAGSGATNEVTTNSLKMVWTPFASSQGGAGDYILTVSKVGTKPDQAINYTVEAHCATDSGEHTGESNPQRIP